jgi:hypothetical protein
VKLLEQPSSAAHDEPRCVPELIIPEARQREKRRRFRIGLAIALVIAIGATVGGIVGAGGAGMSKDPSSGLRPTLPAVGAEALAHTALLTWPAGPPVFTGSDPTGGTGRTVLVEDLGNGGHSVHVLPEIAGGDFPWQIVEVGGYLVYNGTSGVSAVTSSFKGGVRLLGRATYFVPSATPGHVWLVYRRATGPGSATTTTVQLVSVSSGILGPRIALPHDTYLVQGSDEGLLLASQAGELELWQPGRQPATLGSLGAGIEGAGFASNASLVAYGTGCRAAQTTTHIAVTLCSALQVIDVVTGRRLSFPAPAGTAGWVPPSFGANYGLAPNGKWLAAEAATSPAQNDSTELFVLSLAGQQLTSALVPSSHARLFSRAAWSPGGSLLLYQGSADHLDVFRPATGGWYQSTLPADNYTTTMIAVSNGG